MQDSNWDDFRFVLAIAHAGTLSKAATVLGVNQTTVSRRLRTLQDKLSVRLFDQTREGAVPTAAGEEIIRMAQDIAQRMQQIDAKLLGQDAALSGTIHITAMDYLLTTFTPEFASFRALYPQVKLETRVSYLPLNLIQREADVALRVSTSPPESLVGRNFGRVGFAVYGARTRFKASQDIHFAEETWIGWPISINPTQQLERWVTNRWPTATIALRADSIFVNQAWIAAGLGIGVLPCMVADAHPDLVPLKDATDAFNMDLWLLTHPDLKTTARVRAFIDHLATEFEARLSDVRGPYIPV